ncbi:Polysaccharide lyase [Gaiella occulta]|uniref:Polysaccharide lyase n=1 Tax=Gaiella occulta TaxID=1002870 RepID=A0A7M2YTA8_9ACTN|nr:heparin lyase I family protein [Gaiella occulta]RDI73316.1 Polysaccharide lyase [Gaiella occulta]
MAGETDLDLDFEADAVASNVSSFSKFSGLERNSAHQNAVVSSPVRSPRLHAGYFEVHPGDVWAGNNTVRALANRSDTGETTGQEYWWAVSFRVPSTVNPIRDNLVWELHHPASLYNLAALGVAPHAIHLRNEAGTMKVECRVAAGNGTVGVGYANWAPNNVLATLVYDVWISVLVHIVFTETSTGTIEYWIDTTGTVDSTFGTGAPAYSQYSAQTMPYCNSANVHNVSLYTEVGLYTGGSTTDKQSIIYVDGVWRRRTRADAVAKLTGGGSSPANPNDAQPAGYLGGNYTVTGSSLNGSQADKQRCSKILVPTTGTVNQLRVYIEPQAVVGTELVKLAVWRGTSADPSGAPVGTTAELAFTSSSPAGWYVADVLTPFAVTAGETVWAGMINGGAANIAFERYAVSAGAFRLMAAPYANGPIAWDTAADQVFDLDQLINLIGTAGAGTAPANTVPPTVGGAAQVGQSLTVASIGTWTGSPSTFAYQWRRNGVAISGATTSTYVCSTADIGSTIRCTVTAANATGSASADTADTAAVIAAYARIIGLATSGRTSAPRTVGPGRTAGQGGGGG